jgi:magnesium chelatase family protein
MPIAAAILQASAQASFSAPNQAFIGEIGLDGSIRPVRGIIGTLLAGKKAGITTFFIPAGNVAQARLVPGITLVALESITELCTSQNSAVPAFHIQESDVTIPRSNREYDNPVSAVVGQDRAKRALQIAAAGKHNILLYGPPGTGKSMLAKSLPSILPPLTHSEVLEVTHLHSLASHNFDDLITTPPFRSPHNSASYTALLGGGSAGKPGEVSLSHNGVLFLDEFPEFGRQIIEGLRQPLEDKNIVIARSRLSATYPASFILVATANPCPCGYYETSTACRCTLSQILRYRQKVSGPILDRIDLHVAVTDVSHDRLLTNTSSHKQDDALRAAVVRARRLQQIRYSSSKTNSEATNSQLRDTSQLTAGAVNLLNTAAKRLDISARVYVKLVKIGRTIADLDDSESIEIHHISEALQYRPVASRS